MTKNYVNNISLDHGTPASSVVLPEVTTETGTTPKQIYRCTDNKFFEPKLMIAVNRDTTTIQKVMLVDCDLTDAGVEDDVKAETYLVFEFEIGPQDMRIFDEKRLLGLRFRYGVGGYVSTSKTAGSGVTIYVAGVEE